MPGGGRERRQEREGREEKEEKEEKEGRASQDPDAVGELSLIPVKKQQ